MNTNAIRLILRTVAVAALVACGAASTLEAQTADQDETKNNTLTVYLWGSSISGDLSFRDAEVPFDVSLEQILDNLDMAAMVTYKRDIGDWSVVLDVIYLNMGATKDGSVTLPGRRAADRSMSTRTSISRPGSAGCTAATPSPEQRRRSTSSSPVCATSRSTLTSVSTSMIRRGRS